MSSKVSQMKNLIRDLAKHSESSKIKAKRKGKLIDVGLVNQFAKHDLIPNKWFDWVDRVDAKIMLIGQDWGPYIALKKYIDEYETLKDEKDFDYQKFLFKQFSSRTEKFIVNAVEKTYAEKYGEFDQKVWDDFFFTVAVMFTRQGKHFRGNHNFDEKQSFELSYPFLSRQIDIVKPKIIIASGGMALKALMRKFDLVFQKKTLTQIIEEVGDGVIEKDGTIIIPNFHPASYVDPKVMMRIWGKVWR